MKTQNGSCQYLGGLAMLILQFVASALLVSIFVGPVAHAANLGPAKASDLVTLTAGSTQCAASSPFLQSHVRVDKHSLSNGTVEDSFSIPPGTVLVINNLRLSRVEESAPSLDFGKEVFGLKGLNLLIVDPAQGTNSVITLGLYPTWHNQNLGYLIFEQSFAAGVAVKSGAVICGPPDTAIVVHGYLAPDK